MCGEDYTCSDTAQQDVIGLSSAEREYYALTKGGCSGLGSAKLVCRPNLKLQLSLNTESSSAKAVASRGGAGKSTRHMQMRMLWLQERVAAKHLRVVESGNGIKACRHLDAKSGKTELHAKTVDKKPKEVKKLKKVNEAMVTSDATIKNEPNDEVAMIKNESNDATLRWLHTMD